METELKQGAVTVIVPDGVPVLEQAGKLTAKELAREIKSYTGLGVCCQQTSQALHKNVERIAVPNVDLVQMEQESKQAEALSTLVNDLENVLLRLKQNQILLAARAHRKLIRVLAFVKAYQKSDPHILELFPHLDGYFSKKRRRISKTPTTESTVPLPSAPSRLMQEIS